MSTQESQESSEIGQPFSGFPAEIVNDIMAFVGCAEDTQSTLWACCLVSRLWHSAAVPVLYSNPYITDRNFKIFARMVKPYREDKNKLPNLIKTLDMRKMNALNETLSIRGYIGQNSIVTILERCKERLEVFIAPMSKFLVEPPTTVSKYVSCTQTTDCLLLTR